MYGWMDVQVALGPTQKSESWNQFSASSVDEFGIKAPGADLDPDAATLELQCRLLLSTSSSGRAKVSCGDGFFQPRVVLA